MLFSADDKVILCGFLSGSFLVAFLKGLSLGNADGTFEDPLCACLGTASVLVHTQNTLQAQSRIALASLQRLSQPSGGGVINTLACLFLPSNHISKKLQRKANQSQGWEAGHPWPEAS